MSAAAAVAGHLWTVVPTLRDLLTGACAAPAGVAIAIPIVDAVYGRTALAATLRVPPAATELVVLVHGLGGHQRSGYVLHAARELHALGFATLALDLRGADRRGGGFYHVALTDDLVAACGAAALRPFRRLFVLGFSMGGHVALHFAAAPSDARLRGVAALCTPLDLQQTQRHLDRPPLRPYRHYVLAGLKRIYAAVAARHAVPVPLAAVQACRTFHAWDELTITRRYGYASPADFYAANSAHRALSSLAVDCVLVGARHDPIVPPELVLPFVGSAPRLHCRWLPRGGHLHFPGGQDLGLGAPARRSVVAQLAAYWRQLPACA